MKRAIYYILAFALCSCAVQRATTSDEFAKDVQKDLPFKVTELKAVSNRANRRFFGENSTAVIWRNIVINRKAKRVLCIDRLTQNGRTFGYVYVLQSETARYSDSGTFHWNVSDPKLMLNVSDAIEGMSDLSITTLNMQ